MHRVPIFFQNHPRTPEKIDFEFAIVQHVVAPSSHLVFLAIFGMFLLALLFLRRFFV